jgi:hypothetical protein
MTCRVVLVSEAEEQLQEIDRWWQTNRGGAPDLFLDEVARAIDLLSGLPDIGTPFTRTKRAGRVRIE